MKRMTTLKEKYEFVVDEYVKRFEKKHNLQLEFWVADDKTGVACFNDIFSFNVAEIIYDINNKLPKKLIIQWLEDGIEYYEKKGQMINLHSYAKGLRYQDFPDVPVLPETEPELVQFILMNASKLSQDQFASMMENLKEWEEGIKINELPQNPQSCQTDARRSIPWTQDEIDSLMGYEWADDSETLDERLDHARYMNHYESGLNFPSRSLSAVKKKFYEECKKRKAV